MRLVTNFVHASVLLTAVGLTAASGCGKPETPATKPPVTDMGQEAGSAGPVGGGAEIPATTPEPTVDDAKPADAEKPADADKPADAEKPAEAAPKTEDQPAAAEKKE